jgi:membrane associated rhomboid family serine protease
MAITKEEKDKFITSIFFSAGFIILIWIIKTGEWLFQFDLKILSVLPRTIYGLIGIIMAPLLHADFSHLISNSLSMFILGFGVLYFYRTSAIPVFIIVYLLSGILVWLFARSAYHLGASGLIYGFVTFLFFSGLFRRDNKSIALALIVTFLYGSMIWGVFPIQQGVSWEAHLFGSFSGIVCAFIFRHNDPPDKYDWEDEEDDTDVSKLEISYDKKDNINI